MRSKKKRQLPNLYVLKIVYFGEIVCWREWVTFHLSEAGWLLYLSVLKDSPK